VIILDRETIQDQAEKLRQTVKNSTEKLPPRSEIHKDKKNKTKIRIKYPVIRLLALFFVLIPIFILSYTFHFKDQLNTIAPKVSTENYDTIDFVNSHSNNKEIVSENEDEMEDPTDDVQEVVREEEVQNGNASTEEQVAEENVGESGKPVTNTSSTGSDKNETSTKDTTTQEYKVITHKVAADETLFSISIKYYKSRAGEDIIRDWNNLEKTKIYEGQILEIPLRDIK
jgi:LysM repeat protein